MEISDYRPEEHAFEGTTETVELEGSDATGRADFDGMFTTLASVSGVVSYEGHPAVGVTVELSGGLTTPEPVTTDEGGAYSFMNLKRGTYTVAISGYEDDATFEEERLVTLTPENRSGTADFDGVIARAETIGGTVFVEGLARAGVTLRATASFGYGPPEYAETDGTDAGGRYSFTNLRRGDYTVRVVDSPEELGYDFADNDSTTVSVSGGQGGGGVNFDGTQKRSAVIRGTMFLDEDVDADGEYDGKRNAATEENLTVEEVPVQLWKLGRVDPTSTSEPEEWMKVDSAETDERGNYRFDGREAGEYRVVLVTGGKDSPIPGNVAPVASELEDDRSLAWNGEWVHDFPFNITVQRIDAELMIGAAPPHAGWGVCLFDTETNANAYMAGTKSCAKAAGYLGRDTTGADGVASVRFQRARDKTPVKAAGSDMVAFAVVETLHAKDSSYTVAPAADRVVEVTWERKDSTSASPYKTPVVYNDVKVSAVVTTTGGEPLEGWLVRLHANDSTNADVASLAAASDTAPGTLVASSADSTDKKGVATWALSMEWLAREREDRYLWAALAVDGTDPTTDRTHLNLANADYSAVSTPPNTWDQGGNNGLGLSAADWCAGTCEDNAFSHTVVPAGGAKKKDHVSENSANQEVTETYAALKWDGTVAPDSLGRPATVNIARIVVQWDQVDLVVPAHRELDDKPGFTAMDSARVGADNNGLGGTGLAISVDTAALADSVLPAFNADADYRVTGSAYPDGGNHLAFDNVPVDSVDAAIRFFAAPKPANDTADVVVLGDDTVTVTPDGTTHLVVVDAASMADSAAKTRASAFAYKRTDGSITGVVEAATGASIGAKTRAGGVPVKLYDAAGVLVDSAKTSGYDNTGNEQGGTFTFDSLLDGEYTVMVESGIHVGTNASLPGTTVDAADWEALTRLGKLDAKGECVTNTDADTTAGSQWAYNTTTKAWEVVAGNACNEDAYTAVRRIADPTDDADPGNSANAAATINFRVHRTNTEIRGLIYNVRTPGFTDALGNTATQGLSGVTVEIFSTRVSGSRRVKDELVATSTTATGAQVGTYSSGALPEGVYVVEPVQGGKGSYSIYPASRTIRTASSSDSALVGPQNVADDLPKWIYSGDSLVAPIEDEGAGSFGYLRHDAKVTVTVTSVGAQNAKSLLSGARVTLYRCATVTGSGPDVDNAADGSNSFGEDTPSTCTLKLVSGSAVPIGADQIDPTPGVHVFEDLEEGVYRVRVNHDTHETRTGVLVVKNFAQSDVKLQVDLTKSG